MKVKHFTKLGFERVGTTRDGRGLIYKCNNKHCCREIKTYNQDQYDNLMENGCPKCGNMQPMDAD